MAKGMSLHIGLNAVDPKHYDGWPGTLNACEADANDMEMLAKGEGIATKKLLTRSATRAAFDTAMASAAKNLDKGDFFLLTYSGHGGQLPDLNGDEPDGQDETWCLYDGQLIDDEIYKALGAFKAGVRIVMLSDSCHSGSVARAAVIGAAVVIPGAPRYRAIPADKEHSVYLANRKFYDKILRNKALAKAEESVKASVILISGCQDNQLSGDGDFNGVFTGRLKVVWNGGTFKSGYRAFCKKIVEGMPSNQTPNYFRVGAISSKFEQQRPFTV